MEKFISFISDGKKVVGMAHIPEPVTGNRKVCGIGIVMYHGFTGVRTESHCIFVKAARKLAKSGFAVLRIDFAGSGESEGNFRDTTILTEIEDAKNAIRYFKKQKYINKEKLGIIGLSMGGLVAASVAHIFKDIRSLVLWSAVAKPSHVQNAIKAGSVAKAATMKTANIKLKFPVNLVGWEISRKFYNSLKCVDPIKSISNFRNPVLIIHGNEDTSVPVSHALFYKKAVTDRGKIVVIPGADHTFSSKAFEDRVIKITLDWFKKTLK